MMNLEIKNTLTGKKEKFIPHKPDEVSIYVCGVTLYDHIHIGHLKSIVSFEVMRNYFVHQGLKVNFVRNITDVDDKIIAKAKSLNIDPGVLVQEYIDVFHDILNKMGLPMPDVEPRVTEYLEKIEKYIKNLEEKGYAYKAVDGIYFNTQKNVVERYPLSKKIVKDLDNNSRINQENYAKNHKADFALWKEDNEYGFASSIFSKKGRPGWHIECSVMHHHTLGEKFDIHGGGRDLIFPHHENEILQSVAHNGVNPANYWIHNGMMTKDGQKLSKSLGNSIYVKDMLEKHSPESLKLFLNKAQYNQSQEFDEQELKEAHIRWESFVENIPLYKDDNIEKDQTSLLNQAIRYLDDDFNTPQVVALLYNALKNLYQNNSKALADEILELSKMLSIVSTEASLESLYSNWQQKNNVPEKIQLLIEQRQRAKENKDYLLSDALRQEIQNEGWELKDEKNGYKIKRKL
jgi:cysteinyl-tRNA synthetase